MHDILSQGRDRKPNPWPRRLAIIAALVLVAVAVVRYLPGHRHASAGLARTPVTASPAAPPAPAPVAAGIGAPGLPAEPNGIAGPTLPWASSVRLPVAGTHPVWFWPATGRSEPIDGLPGDRSGYQFIRVGGGWAVQANPAAGAGCGNCAGPPLTAWFLADEARAVTPIGTANLIAPAATAGAVWLTSYPPGADMGTATGTAREVSIAGAVLRPQVRLPSGYVIDQATDRGLLLAPVSVQPGTAGYKLWDPAAPRAIRTFSGVIAASAKKVAWTGQCTPLCRVQVLDLATDQQTVVVLPNGSSVASAAFSPGGGFLALQVSFGNSGDGGALAMQLEVASVTAGRLTPVPGTWVSSDALIGFGWPAASDSLVGEFSFTTKTELASWRPGTTRPAVTSLSRRGLAVRL